LGIEFLAAMLYMDSGCEIMGMPVATRQFVLTT